MMRCSLSVLLLLLLVSHLIQSQLFENVLPVALCMAHCADERCQFQDCNETPVNVTKIIPLETTAGSNASLQCRDVNRLVIKHNPGIYIIEQKSTVDNVWKVAQISKNQISVRSNLEPDREYRFRIRRVTPIGVSQADVTGWFRTNKANYIPMEVKNISIGRIKASTELPEQLETYLNIKPADDLNCIYDIVHWAGDHNLFHYQLDADYRVKLSHLKYNARNVIHIVSRNEVGLQQSKNATLTFDSPSCLDIHFNLSVCAPDPVEGLRIVEMETTLDGKVNLKITWNEPELQPDNYTVIVQPLDWKEETAAAEVTVSGNESTANVANVTTSDRYKIGVIAESEAGTSLQWLIVPAVAVATTSFRPSTWDISPAVIAAATTLMTLALCLTIAFTLYRHRVRLKGYAATACQYTFFENISRADVCTFESNVKQPLDPERYHSDEETLKLDKFEISPERLKIIKVLGSGIGGIVKLASFKMQNDRTMQVAVKMLRENATKNDLRDFYREISLMKSAGNHRNIVSLIGYCTIVSESPLLIVEYCSEGDLQSYMRKIFQETTSAILQRTEWRFSDISPYLLEARKEHNSHAINNLSYDFQAGANIGTQLSEGDLLNFARQVATGMEFLSSNRIVHRDLAARNVLICSDRTAKISDFGLSRDIYQENVYKKQSDGKLPIKWMAIEALTHQIYTTHSDVWSFGVLLYEIVTLGGNPYPGLQSGEILPLIKSGYRMEKPCSCGMELYKIMRSCWRENPAKRPSFSELKLQLDKLISELTNNDYLNLSDLLYDSMYHPLPAKNR